ncbi:hypothetical protein DFH07DRAFT_765572 [Mycena maculata]|uniref:Chromo domain-containing protein n=1 Tax=Mycena maculata TaxID=230809 RepID=A0AAD7K8E1_9AGAR|nr:hypothetical protein DFH07DRAFT_765572 [Mycena maculata]
MSTYTLELSTELKNRHIHPTFHSSLLRPHQANDETIFPSREANRFYDFSMPDDPEWFIDEIIAHRWVGPRSVEFHVKWTAGDFTWEKPSALNDTHWVDNERYIEARHQRGKFYDRVLEGGTWQGPDEIPTWVPAVGVPIDVPPPPFVPRAVRDAHLSAHDRTIADVNALGYTQPRHDGRPKSSGHFGARAPSRSEDDRSPYARNERSFFRYKELPRESPRYGPTPPVDMHARRRNRSPYGRESTMSSSRASYSSRGSHTSSRTSSSHHRGRSVSPRCDYHGAQRRDTPHHRGKPYEHRVLPYDSHATVASLRAVVLDSRCDRTVHPPEIATADRDEQGHPICPLEDGHDDESDYGSDTESARLPHNWAADEHERRQAALSKEKNGTIYDKKPLPQGPELGPWAGLDLVTVEQGANIIRWVRRTEPGAYAYMHYWMRMSSKDATAARSPGLIYLLSKQGSATREYRILTTGSPFTPPKKLRPPRRHAPAQMEATSSELPPPPPETPNVPRNTEEDVVMTDPAAMARLGESVAPMDQTSVILTDAAAADAKTISATHTSYAQAGAIYEKIRPVDWPHGFRVSETEYAPADSVSRTPYSPDVASWLTANGLFPVHVRNGTSIERALFAEVAWQVLSVSGTYARIAELREYTYNDLPLEHYPFSTSNIGWSHVVSWFMQHGIGPNSDALRRLESFARSRWNVTSARSDPTQEDFQGALPCNRADVDAISAADVIPWTSLHHVALPGTVSGYPLFPAGATNA